MNKKQAYKLVNYLLDEAYGILNYADSVDVKAVSSLLSTANYYTKSFRLEERDDITIRIHSLRREAMEYIENAQTALENVFI